MHSLNQTRYYLELVEQQQEPELNYQLAHIAFCKQVRYIQQLLQEQQRFQQAQLAINTDGLTPLALTLLDNNESPDMELVAAQEFLGLSRQKIWDFIKKACEQLLRLLADLYHYVVSLVAAYETTSKKLVQQITHMKVDANAWHEKTFTTITYRDWCGQVLMLNDLVTTVTTAINEIKNMHDNNQLLFRQDDVLGLGKQVASIAEQLGLTVTYYNKDWQVSQHDDDVTSRLFEPTQLELSGWTLSQFKDTQEVQELIKGIKVNLKKPIDLAKSETTRIAKQISTDNKLTDGSPEAQQLIEQYINELNFLRFLGTLCTYHARWSRKMIRAWITAGQAVYSCRQTNN